MSDVPLEYLKQIRLVAMRHQGAHDPVRTDQTWQDLIVWASPRRLLGRDLGIRGVGILWDDPRAFSMHERRYDVGVPIDAEDAGLVEAPAFSLVTMPGRYLRFTHMGAYDEIMRTYDEAFSTELRWGGYDLLAAPILEIYRNSPSEVAAEDLHTDIYFPVLKH
jgi:DNA gyrase inhibitor GyrI